MTGLVEAINLTVAASVLSACQAVHSRACMYTMYVRVKYVSISWHVLHAIVCTVAHSPDASTCACPAVSQPHMAAFTGFILSSSPNTNLVKKIRRTVLLWTTSCPPGRSSTSCVRAVLIFAQFKFEGPPSFQLLPDWYEEKHLLRHWFCCPTLFTFSVCFCTFSSMYSTRSHSLHALLKVEFYGIDFSTKTAEKCNDKFDRISNKR